MPYARSKARVDFEADLQQEIALLRKAGPTKISDSTVRGYIFSSVITKGSALLENYLEKLLFDWFGKLTSLPTRNDAVSQQTRIFLITHSHVNDYHKRFISHGDEGIYLDTVSATLGSPEWQLLHDAANVPNLDFMVVLKNRRYPSPKNIRLVFRRIGIPRIFQRLNAVANRDVEQLLQSYNDTRNDFAHNGVVPGVTAADVRKLLKDLHLVVNALDRVTCSFICSSCGVTHWTR